MALAGSLVLRGGDIADFIGFLGSQDTRSTQVETYSQRTVLIYIGVRIFRDHPLTGVGWQGSELPSSFEPYLGDARRRFPDVARRGAAVGRTAVGRPERVRPGSR